MCSCTKCCRDVLMIGCVFLWVVSLGIIGLGIWQYLERDQEVYEYMDRSARQELFVLAILYMATGSVWFFLVIPGWLGASRENKTLLRLFAVAQLIMIAPLATSGVLSLKYRTNIIEGLETNPLLSQKQITGYYDTEDKAIDHLQEKFHCCGINSYKDYNENIYFSCQSDASPLKCSVPYTCCNQLTKSNNGLINISCGTGVLAESSTNVDNIIYTEGCKSAMLSKTFVDNMIVTGVIALAVIAVIIVCVIQALVTDRRLSVMQHSRRDDYMDDHRTNPNVHETVVNANSYMPRHSHMPQYQMYRY